eukprot:gnl/MRDRNA2_/MRDRNA2_78698_c0_seq1.p1 gnl/MRDRNA2_/MRDRNA2_78698_c0~~gnl/MRDRNA2_/MRDRNA2_78698_c0_seq1.p1  ORF type:complete len:847 (+),score=207.29 gnl/MRDRNA2_/MRDRNA2_78698_c0_seq1:83-2623(+)
MADFSKGASGCPTSFGEPKSNRGFVFFNEYKREGRSWRSSFFQQDAQSEKNEEKDEKDKDPQSGNDLAEMEKKFFECLEGYDHPSGTIESSEEPIFYDLDDLPDEKASEVADSTHESKPSSNQLPETKSKAVIEKATADEPPETTSKAAREKGSETKSKPMIAKAKADEFPENTSKALREKESKTKSKEVIEKADELPEMKAKAVIDKVTVKQEAIAGGADKEEIPEPKPKADVENVAITPETCDVGSEDDEVPETKPKADVDKVPIIEILDSKVLVEPDAGDTNSSSSGILIGSEDSDVKIDLVVNGEAQKPKWRTGDKEYLEPASGCPTNENSTTLVPFGPKDVVEPLDLERALAEMPPDVIRMKFRRPDILGAAVDLVGGYLGKREVAKARSLMEMIMPVCRQFGGIWLIKALNHMAAVRMQMGFPAESLSLLMECEQLAENEMPSKKKDWDFFEDLYRKLAGVHDALKNEDKAVEFAQKAINVKESAEQPVSWFDLWDLGHKQSTMALMSNDRTKITRASQTLEKALRQHIEKGDTDLVMRAKIWHIVGECSFALAHLKHTGGKGVQLAPNTDEYPLNDDAKALYKRALKSFQQAYKLFSKIQGRTNARTGQEAESISWTLLRLGEYSEAKPFLLNAVEALGEKKHDWNSSTPEDAKLDGSSTNSVLLRSMQTADQILEAHRQTNDRSGLTQYFDAIERLCDKAISRMRKLPKEQEKRETIVFERMLSNCSMVLVASGTPEGTLRSQKIMSSRLSEKPSSQQAQFQHMLFQNLFSNQTPPGRANSSSTRQAQQPTPEKVPKLKLADSNAQKEEGETKENENGGNDEQTCNSARKRRSKKGKK